MLRVLDIQVFALTMRTRFPFRFGIAHMTELPHLFVRSTVEIDGRVYHGISADGLTPKWFTKNPATTFEEDLPEMLGVIGHAASVAGDIGPASDFFTWWNELQAAQSAWARNRQIAPLLAGLGTSLLERSVLDALCRAFEIPVFQALQQNRLGIDLGAMRPALKGIAPRDVLPPAPSTAVAVRHAVGLGDPLTDDDIAAEDVLNDGLPHALDAGIRAYGLRYFKVKLLGDVDYDRSRLHRLADIISREVPQGAKLTLDGNENFPDLQTFRDHWTAYCSEPAVRAFFERTLLFVEQPLHRICALDDSVRTALESWPDAPPIIIDESDGDFDSLPRALDLGYAGTSHKNAKGIMKGLANAALIRSVRNAGRRAILSAEDLGNVGPVALLQDFAIVAALGIDHVERNGHHYFAGLSMFPESEQQRVLANHPDLYRRHPAGYPVLAIAEGAVTLTTVNSAPFGVAEIPDLQHFEKWDLAQDST